MKKTILGVYLVFLTFFTYAQNGLENIIVEKYYISNSADSIGSIGRLPIGSVTYRVYVDMLPGYKFQAAYGVPGHTLLISTSTGFFNNEDRGATTPNFTFTNAQKNSVMLDSWLSCGAACTGRFGIFKTEDNVGTGGANAVNNTSPQILQNNDPLAGIPLTTQDGIYTGTTEAVTFVGISSFELRLFNDSSYNAGNTFSTSNGSWAALNGATGPGPSNNKVLIAQMTTDGIFHFELNIQIGTPTGGVQNYVSSNPDITAGEITIPSLTQTFGGTTNQLPTVSITAPANNSSFITGAVAAIDATAADADGTVSSVEFFVDGTTSIGIDNTSPYSVNYTTTSGTHILTAKATDNNGGVTTSAPITINVTNNPPPVVNITAPSNGSSYTTGTVVAIAATATDNGSVTQVEFFVDAVSIGIDNTSPYTINYTSTSGSHVLTATATDNLGAAATSLPVNITVGNNIPPTVDITAPLNGALYTAPAVVAINADASDANGSITLVEFYVNGILVGSDATAPYSYSWTSVIGNANLTAKATDNLGAQTTSSVVSISIANPNIPYKIITANNTCLPSTFCVPINSISPVQNVIGYDIVLSYDKLKVTPTGNITIGNALITPSYVDVDTSINSVLGEISIYLSINATAPANTFFNGTGNLMCVEFNKTAGFSSVDTAIFSISSLQESYITGVTPKTVDPGKYITYKDTAFHGILKFWNNNVPLGYNTSNPSQYLVTNIFGNNNTCTNKSNIAVQPDAAGAFDYSVTNGQKMTIERDIAGNTSVQSVVNGFDALQVRKMLKKDPSFIPSVYQYIAADVNLDGVVSAGDVTQINQRVVLLIPEFKQAWNYNAQGVSNGQLSKDWLFIDSTTAASNAGYHISATFPMNDGVGYSKSRVPAVPFCLSVPGTNFTTCPQITSESFRGILLGDINGSFATAGAGSSLKMNASEKIIFDLENAAVSDEFIEIPVSCNSSSEVNALDFSLKYNESNIRFESVIDHTGNLEMLSNYNEDDKTLRLTSNSLQDYDLNNPVLSVRFEIMNNHLDKSDLNSIEGYLNGNKVNVEFRNANPNEVNKDYQVRIYPNPAAEILNVEISEDAVMQLLGIDGKTVISEKNINALEKHEINIHGLSSGIYVMRIRGEKFSVVKRIVIKN